MSIIVAIMENPLSNEEVFPLDSREIRKKQQWKAGIVLPKETNDVKAAATLGRHLPRNAPKPIIVRLAR